MRIISEFHDYYDVVQAQGQDLTVVWNRKTEEIVTKPDHNRYIGERPEYPFPILRSLSSGLNISQYIIGFCGKIYPVLSITEWTSGKKTVFCYSLEEFDTYVEEHFDSGGQKEYFRTKGVGKWWKRKTPGRRRYYQEFFDECAQKQDAFEEIFREHHSPIFVATISRSKSSITLNPCLKDYEFYRVFDVYTAFQEIAMYYGGVLGGVREHIPEVSDKDMVEAKGFDKKWSFRKEPQKKR